MTEPTLELPQVSLSRYIDLLKRRRWQVIPVSLLGLLIGGVVAFFIPRYYVAETRIDYSSALADDKSDDPFEYVVDNATLVLPQAAAATMRKLGWPEGMVGDPQKLHENARKVEDRIKVHDVNPGRNRSYAQLVVTYRDRDGPRAAEFTNALVETWMEERIGEMRRSAEAQAAQANRRMHAANASYNQLNRDLTDLSRQYNFQRLLSPDVQREEMRLHEEKLEERRQLLDTTEREIATLEQQIENLHRALEITPRMVMPTAESLRKRFAATSKEAKWFAELESIETSLESITGAAHPYLALYRARAEQLKKQLQGAMGPAGSEIPNPKLEELREAIEAKQVLLAAAQKIHDRLQKQVEADDAQRRRRIDAAPEYVAKQAALDQAEKEREEARLQLTEAMRRQEQLDSTPPIRQANKAYVPRRPTEPDIVLVAILGCVLGLGAAVALILVLDTLRGTLKTVDDVERALPVPVLGGLSHLETDEQRLKVNSSRRRTSLVAGLLLAGGVVVVTTYYVAPHRLPPFARDLLSMVLGG